MTTVPEGALLPIVTDTEADPLTPMRHNKGTDSDRPRSGWNDSHPHNTQFRNHLQANGCFNVGPMDTLLDQFSTMVSSLEQVHNLEDGTTNYTYPMALHNDVLHYGDMLQADDHHEFVDSMKDEMKGLKDMLQVVPHSTLPTSTKTLLAVWAFKR